MSKLKQKTILFIVHNYTNFQKDQIESIAPFFKRVYVLFRYKPLAEIGGMLNLSSFKKHLYRNCFDQLDIPDNVQVFPTSVYYLPTNKAYFRLGRQHYRQALRAITQKNISYDLIHSHFAWSAGYVGHQLKQYSNKPFVLTTHRYDIKELPYINSNWNRSITDVCRSADVLVTCSYKNVESTSKLNSSLKPMVIPNGFNSKKFFKMDQKKARQYLKLPSQAKIIVSVASLDFRKGHHLLISAVAKLKNRMNLQLYIIGSGKQKKQLLKQISDLDLSDNVHLVGEVNHHDINRWMNAADISILPSQDEGNPTVMFESLATDVGGISEVLTAETGLVFPTASVQTVMSAMTKAFSISWDRAKIARIARQYRWDEIAKKYLELYKSVLTTN